VEIHLHSSLYLRRKSLPLPSLSLYPLYSDICIQMTRLKAAVLSLCFRPTCEWCSQRPADVHLFLYIRDDGSSWLLCNVGARVPDLGHHVPEDVRVAAEAIPKINKIFSLLLIFNLHEFLYFIKIWCGI
jgi:hypothetical protein